jgi:hypothetical protein
MLFAVCEVTINGFLKSKVLFVLSTKLSYFPKLEDLISSGTLGRLSVITFRDMIGDRPIPLFQTCPPNLPDPWIMSSPQWDDELAQRMNKNRRTCARKLKEHQRRALNARVTYENMRPRRDADPPAHSTALSPSFTMTTRFGSVQPGFKFGSSRAAPRAHQGRYSDDADDPDDDVVADLMQHLGAPRSHGIRYNPGTRKWAWDILRTCGIKALEMVRDKIPLPSRQSLSRKPPDGYHLSDLTDPRLIVERAKEWRKSVTTHFDWKQFPRCVIACDALAFKPDVAVTGETLSGIDLTHLEFNYDLLESLTASSEAFHEFVAGNWDSVFQAAFVYQLQPLDPNIDTCILYAHPAPDGKARLPDLAMMGVIKEICRKQHMTVGAFATDADPGYDPAHNSAHATNVKVFKTTYDVPRTQKFRAISDILHILKRARYWMLKNPQMVVGLDSTARSLDVQVLRDLFRGDLPAIVFCDDKITKMYDSLPMVLFRFECLGKLQEAREWGWVAYFFPWVLINEAMSHTKARTVDRLGWFRLAYCYMMKCSITYAETPLPEGMLVSAKRDAPLGARRTLFDRKLLMHATDSVSAIIYEIHNAELPISLQRLMTTPVEHRFGVTRVHAGTHQTMVGILKAMEEDEAMKYAYAQHHVKNRRLAYGETVDPCKAEHDLRDAPILYIDALLHFLGFPAAMNRLITNDEDVIHDYVEILISDELLPFAKTNFAAMSGRKRRSLYQEMAGVATTSRHIILSAKTQVGRVFEAKRPTHPIEQHLANVLGRRRIVSWELKAIIEQVCEVEKVVFDGPHPLKRSTKRELVEWIELNWGGLGQTFTTITANQLTVPRPSYPFIESHVPEQPVLSKKASKPKGA